MKTRSTPKRKKLRAAAKTPPAAKPKSIKQPLGRADKGKARSSGTQAKRPIDVRLRSLLHAIPDVVYFKDAEGRNLIVNKAFEKLAGRKSKDILGRTDDELLPPKLAAKCRQSDEAAIISRVPVRFEEDYAGPDGDLRFYETIKSAMFDDRGKVLGLVGVSRDITERKIWEKRLGESEERFRSLFENATVGLYRTTPGDRIILANPTLVRMLGYSHFKQLSDRNLKESGFEPSYPRIQFIRRIEKEGEIKGLETAWKRSDGTIIYVRESAKAIRDRNGRTLYYEGTVEDITERKKAEQVLEESERRFRTIIETAQEAIFLKGRDSRLTHVNPAMAAFFGVPAADLIGRTDAELFGGEEAAGIAADDRKVLAGEIVREERSLSIQGKTYIFSITKVPMRNETGETTGICGIAHDMTERKQMEEALRLSLQEKEVLLKEIHHRVKNNMQIISSILNLQAGSVKDPAALECLRKSQSRIRSMALVHEKLYRSRDYSRIDFGEYLSSLASALFQSCRTDSNQIRLDFKAEEVFLDINTAIPCGLVANELIVNALKCAFPEGRSGVVKIRLRPLGQDNYRLIISDDGVGFPKDLNFRKTESLGMQLVTLLVGQLDGTIDLKRKGGTTFDIVFKEQKKKKQVAGSRT
jgi:PAS domain S-box-containing protein